MERSRLIAIALIVFSIVTVINGRLLTQLSVIQLATLVLLSICVHMIGLKSSSMPRLGLFSPLFSFFVLLCYLLIANSHGDLTRALPTFESLIHVFQDTQAGVREIRNSSSPFNYSTEIFLVLITAQWAISEIYETFTQRLHSCSPSVMWFVTINALLLAQEGSPSLFSFIISVAGASWFFLYAFERGYVQVSSHVIDIPSSSVYSNRMRLGISFLSILLISILLALPITFTPDIGPDNLFNWLNNQKEQTELSPLVGMSQKLREQETRVLFTARAPEAQYFRVEVLDDFDGDSWKAPASKKQRPEQIPSGVQVRELNGTVRLNELSNKNPPTFYSVQSLSDENITFQRFGIVRNNDEALKTYSFSSLVPPTTLTPEQIQLSSDEVPSEVESSMLLPGKDTETGNEKFDPAIIEKARSIASRYSSLYEQVIALRDFFLDGSFTYDLNVDYTSSTQSMQAFLESRRGFCEQFATTFAAMVRSIGVPSRVVIGFIPGEPDETGLFTVTNKQAHAWVEVYFSGFGWLTLDPTPSGSLPGQSPTNIGAVAPTTTTTTLVPQSSVVQSSTAPSTTPTTPINRDKKSSTSPLLLILLISLLLGGAGILLIHYQRNKRNDAAYIVATFKDIGERVLNVPPSPDLTIKELSERIDEKNRVALEFLALLAIASYAPDPDISQHDLRTAAARARSTKIIRKE